VTGEGSGEDTVASYVTYVVLNGRISPDVRKQWEELASKASRLSEQWGRQAAAALAADRPLPPVPAGPNLSNTEVAVLAQDWAKKTGAETLAAVQALPPARQVGLIGALTESKKWESPLVKAQLTITEAHAAGEAMGEIGAWKGRQLDEKLSAEIVGWLRQQVLAGKAQMISLTTSHPLSGVALAVRTLPNKAPTSVLKQFRIPGLEKRPPPEGVVMRRVMVRAERNQGVQMVQPLWKDAKLSEAWEHEHARANPEGVKAPKERNSGQENMNDPAGFLSAVARAMAGEVGVISSFQLMYYASPIGDEPEH